MNGMGVFNKIADAIFNGKAKDIYPENSEEESLIFAEEIKKTVKRRVRNDSNSNKKPYKEI
ncbi:hypothetical protein [Natronobacillus azotifigens]|uniref:Uncharacterized protein n=1 Tax=Natronobacillus azotifigens TaxID=472978 RepID=A0A9J6RB50_9BACI|nr:hypothetical protein [Natronobacillus azotifigens]MCZ0702906.1 hypothetical protein [Natronobacillus azotifigens]